MTQTNVQEKNSVVKTRRRHRKSRSGCFECKRRRIKCDESKPSCIRCTSLLEKCIYPPQSPRTNNDERGGLSLPTSTYNHKSPLSSAFCGPMGSSSTASSCSSTSSNAIDRCSIATGNHESSSEADLYNHYLRCTSISLTRNKADQAALHREMPQLALRSTTVLHSLLAASAVCLCHDLVSKEVPPAIDAVNQILLTGYRHYNLAIQQIRESMSSRISLDPGILLASAILLVPFATASQRINHWMSSSSVTGDSRRLLSTTPRDVIVIMRAIRTMLETQRSGTSNPGQSNSVEYDDPALEKALSTPLNTSRTHVMFPILAATIQPALAKLQQRLDAALFNLNDGKEELLSGCATAFQVLQSIVNKVFSPPNDGKFLAGTPTDNSFELKHAKLPQIPPWLQSYARKATGPLSTDPLTSLFLGFLIQVPQAYLDIAIPLLDQRLESPFRESDVVLNGNAAELTVVQALVLDIYAHWSVLMFLVEEESWWIGDLPIVTLSGMVNRYGNNFVGMLCSGMADSEAWWPGSMLAILREVKRHR